MADPREPVRIASTPDTNTDNVWTRTNRFLGALIASLLELPGGAVTGSVWTCRNAQGFGDWSDKAPATRQTLTAQVAGSTGTIVTAASGEYLATVYLECTTAGAAGTLDLTLTYTDDVGLTTTASITGPLALNAQGRAYGTAVLRCSGGGIDYTLTPTGPVGGPVFAAYVSLVRIG